MLPFLLSTHTHLVCLPSSLSLSLSLNTRPNTRNDNHTISHSRGRICNHTFSFSSAVIPNPFGLSAMFKGLVIKIYCREEEEEEQSELLQLRLRSLGAGLAVTQLIYTRIKFPPAGPRDEIIMVNYHIWA